MPLTMKDVVAKGLAVIVDPNGGIEATPREPQPPGAPGGGISVKPERGVPHPLPSAGYRTHHIGDPNLNIISRQG